MIFLEYEGMKEMQHSIVYAYMMKWGSNTVLVYMVIHALALALASVEVRPVRRVSITEKLDILFSEIP